MEYIKNFWVDPPPSPSPLPLLPSSLLPKQTSEQLLCFRTRSGKDEKMVFGVGEGGKGMKRRVGRRGGEVQEEGRRGGGGGRGKMDGLGLKNPARSRSR